MKKLILFVLASIFGISMAFSQPIIKIWNSEDSLGILTQVSQYLDYLDVRECVFLHVSFSALMPEGKKGITYQINVPDTLTHYPIIKVRIDARMNRRGQKLALAHEMIHVKQYVKGELHVKNQNHINWKGRRYAYQYLHDSRLAPWELEAYRNDGELVNVFSEEQFTPTPAVASRANP